MTHHPVDYKLQEARELRARGGRTKKQVEELRFAAARSATCCAGCFHPLAPTDSVTIYSWQVNRHNSVRVPLCLFCTLDNITLVRIGDGHYWNPGWHRTRCLNCHRPMRVHGHPPFRPTTCCTDCAKAWRNRSNNLRRRVKHPPQTCIACGRSFVAKRKGARTCCNGCRQAMHRDSTSAAASVIRDKRRRVTSAVASRIRYGR
jgi:hypothetical protein